MSHTATVEVPAYYAREIEEREAIADACPIKVFTSSINPRWGWPWKLNNSTEARVSAAGSCRELMIDPGLRNVACSPEIAHAASKTGADCVIARDISPEHPAYGDREDRHLRAVETAVNYLAFHREATDGSDRSVGKWDVLNAATPLFPIQPPFAESLAYMAEEFEREYYRPDGGKDWYTICPLDVVEHVAVGGLLSLPDVGSRIQALREVRATVGPDVEIHALAPGTDLDMLGVLRNEPELVDSLDVSTPENAVKNNKIPDKTWTQHRHQIPTGTDSTTVRAQFSGAIAVQLAYMLTPSLCTDESFDSVESYQGTLGMSA